MNYPDEVLMAYADGELDAATRHEIESAMAQDPELARAVARHRAVAARVRAAYDGVLAEPVPERLAQLLREPTTPPVTELAPMRERRRPPDTRWHLPAWAAMAASVLVGIGVGVLVAREPESHYGAAGGGLVARGELARALTGRLAGAPADSGVHIGITFRDHQGDFCRSFAAGGDAGLACRSGGDWRIRVLAEAPPGGELRAAAGVPLPVLQAIDAAIDGEPLDAAQELAARDANWNEPTRP